MSDDPKWKEIGEILGEAIRDRLWMNTSPESPFRPPFLCNGCYYDKSHTGDAVRVQTNNCLLHGKKSEQK